jgi:outer membrane receptor protein involved in Fe transport
VTAVRPEELPEDPSSFATVIETDDYEGESKSVEGLLDDSVGVQVRRFGGPGQAAEVSIRGSTGQQVVVLLDGVRLNTAQSGTVDLSTLPIELVDRIEVSRGGGSVLAGSGAIGGVVNVVTKRGDGRSHTTASFDGGSFGTWEGSLSQSGRVGPVDYGVAYTGFSTDGDWKFQSVEVRASGQQVVPSEELRRINNESESHSVLLQAAGDLAPGLRARATDQLYYLSRGEPGPDVDPEAPDGGQSATAHERRTRNVASLHAEADGWEPLPDGVRLESTVSYLFEESRFRNPEPDIGLPIETRQKNRSGAFAGRGILERRGFGIDHTATLGLDLRYDSLSDADAGFHQRTTEGFSLQDELSVWRGRLQLVPAVRFDHNDDFGSEWIPRVGVIVNPVPWLRFKANGERSYRVPDFDELYFPDKGFIRGNPNLEPERAWNGDAGVELGFAKIWRIEKLRLQTAYFYQEIDNSIVFQRVSPTTVAPTNTNQATVQGVEVAASLEIFGWVGLSANWTHQQAKLASPRLPSVPGLFPPIGSVPGTALPGRADDEYTLRAQVGPSSGLFKLVAERHHTSKIPLSYSDAPALSSRNVYDLSGVVDLAQLWRPVWRFAPRKLLAQVAVTNVTDESVRDSFGFPQPGRTLTFGLEGHW